MRGGKGGGGRVECGRKTKQNKNEVKSGKRTVSGWLERRKRRAKGQSREAARQRFVRTETAAKRQGGGSRGGAGETFGGGRGRRVGANANSWRSEARTAMRGQRGGGARGHARDEPRVVSARARLECGGPGGGGGGQAARSRKPDESDVGCRERASDAGRIPRGRLERASLARASRGVADEERTASGASSGDGGRALAGDARPRTCGPPRCVIEGSGIRCRPERSREGPRAARGPETRSRRGVPGSWRRGRWGLAGGGAARVARVPRRSLAASWGTPTRPTRGCSRARLRCGSWSSRPGGR